MFGTRTAASVRAAADTIPTAQNELSIMRGDLQDALYEVKTAAHTVSSIVVVVGIVMLIGLSVYLLSES